MISHNLAFLYPNTLLKTQWNSVPYADIEVSIQLTLSTSQQIQNLSSHSPQHLKQKQNHVPSFLPTSHWRSKWIVVYPPFLQIQHLIYNNHLALSLVGAFVFWILFQGKWEPSLKHKAFIESSNLKCLPYGRNLMEYKMSQSDGVYIFSILPQFDGV